MRKPSMRGVVTFVVCIGLTCGYAFAKDNDHRDAKERHVQQERARAHERSEIRQKQRREWREHDRQSEIASRHERERWRREHAADRHRPGWDHGKKTGWNKCDVPPGQAKRNGCDMNAYYQRHSDRRPTASKPPLTDAQRDALRQEREKQRAEWLKQHPQAANVLPPQPAK